MQSGNSAFLVLAHCQHPYRLHTRCCAIDANNLPDRHGSMFPMAGITRNAPSLYTISYRNHGRIENSKRLAQPDSLYCLPGSHDHELIGRTRAQSRNLCNRCRLSYLRLDLSEFRDSIQVGVINVWESTIIQGTSSSAQLLSKPFVKDLWINS
jgi:hypothetical protein